MVYIYNGRNKTKTSCNTMNEKRNISVYMALNSQDITQPLEILKVPVNYIPLPSENDYSIGYIDRYFVKKINNTFSYETTQLDYSDIDSTLWQRVSLRWKLTGTRFTENNSIGIEPFNRTEIEKASLSINEIKNLLTNPIQFSRF